MALLSKEQFVKQSKGRLGPVTVSVPSGGEVQLCRVAGSVVRGWRQSLTGKDGVPNKQRREKSAELFLSHVMLDDSGALMFSETEVLAGVMDVLGSEDTEYLTDVAFRLNGIGVHRPDDLEKNSETTDAKESSAE